MTNSRLVLRFRLCDPGHDCNSTEGTFTGQIFDGQVIDATDAAHMLWTLACQLVANGPSKRRYDR